MKIVQLLTRRSEFQKFKEINQKHNNAWIKTILYNSIFFPIADIISSFTLGAVVFMVVFKSLMETSLPLLEIYFLIPCL
jgi:ABC-type multidrug transport system fused ATPase/permease subunit